MPGNCFIFSVIIVLLTPHNDDGANLHQVAPGLGQPAFWLAGHLAGARFAAQLPEQLGDLHQPGRGDGVANTQQPAGGADRHIAIPGCDAVCGQPGRFAAICQQQALQVVQLFVVKGVIGLDDVDLLARFFDAGHLVGHPRGVFHIARVGQVPVGPVGGVQIPAHALDPDRFVA